MKKLSPKVALATAALLVAPALTSCGFNYATDQLYVPGVGTNDRDGDVDILNALIVSSEDGSGTFIATFVNNSLEDETAFTGLGGGIEADTFESVTIPTNAAGVANLHSEELGGGIKVTGDIVAGLMADVTLTFSDQTTQMQVPIVPNSGTYAGIDGPAAPDEDEDH